MDVNAESLNSLGQKAQQQDCIWITSNSLSGSERSREETWETHLLQEMTSNTNSSSLPAEAGSQETDKMHFYRFFRSNQSKGLFDASFNLKDSLSWLPFFISQNKRLLLQ